MPMLPIGRRALASAFGLFVFSASFARAQTIPPDSARVASLHAALLTIPLESPIRIRTVGQSILEGRLASRSDTDVVVRQRNDSLRAPMAHVAEVSRRISNVKSGAITGGMIGGAVLGLLGGGFAIAFCDRADCHGSFSAGATAGVTLGVPVGAAIGLGVGALTHHWQPFWP